MHVLEIALISLISTVVLLGLFLLWYPKSPDLVNKLLLTFPVVVALFLVIEGVFWRMITGHGLFGISASVGVMLMVVSLFTIPFAILRGTLR